MASAQLSPDFMQFMTPEEQQAKTGALPRDYIPPPPPAQAAPTPRPADAARARKPVKTMTNEELSQYADKLMAQMQAENQARMAQGPAVYKGPAMPAPAPRNAPQPVKAPTPAPARPVSQEAFQASGMQASRPQPQAMAQVPVQGPNMTNGIVGVSKKEFLGEYNQDEKDALHKEFAAKHPDVAKFGDNFNEKWAGVKAAGAELEDPKKRDAVKGAIGSLQGVGPMYKLADSAGNAANALFSVSPMGMLASHVDKSIAGAGTMRDLSKKTRDEYELDRSQRMTDIDLDQPENK